MTNDDVVIGKSDVAAIRELISVYRDEKDPKVLKILILKLEHLLAERR